MIKIKKLAFICLVALSWNNISAYTSKITTLGKGDKRFVLISDIHESKTFVSNQEKFFKELFKNLNTHNPEQTLFFHELVEDIGDSYANKTIEDNSELFNAFKSLSGKSLASLRFLDKERKFTTKNFDFRDSQACEARKNCPETHKDLSIVTATEIDNFLINIEDEEKQEHYRKAVQETTGNNVLAMMGATSDLHLMELLEKSKNNYSQFLVHGGQAHTDLISKLLKIEGWQPIDTLNTTNPENWTTQDSILSEIFPKPEEPTEEWTVIDDRGRETEEDSLF
ncbi:MAG: hypothetical protein ACJAZS_000456 [Alteromonas naphthalenivorans]|jgi:hypothetical protein